VIRTTLISLAVAGTTLISLAVAGTALAAAGPAAASSPPAPHPPGWTVYGDVIVEVVSPRDSNSGMPGVR
jgi:hypothetical protein